MKKKRIGIYVPGKHARPGYKQESYNIRQNAGMAVVTDILQRAGYALEYTGAADVNRYDYVFVSITDECDWWPFVRERLRWPAGDYRVVCGGFGVLNVRPYLQYADYFVLGRAEGVITRLIEGQDPGDSVIDARTFDPEAKYRINQAPEPYPETVTLANGRKFTETMIGCPNNCHFCGYTWHRKHSGGDFRVGDLWAGGLSTEVTMPELAKGGPSIDWHALRTTALDGLSQRLRKMVHKPVTKDIFKRALFNIATKDRDPNKGRRVIIYNIIGYPTETEADWREFMADIAEIDRELPESERKAGVIIHSTPFKPQPETPLACAPMEKREFRGALARTLAPGLQGYRLFDGRALFVTDSQTVEGLPLLMETAINLRATEEDAGSVEAVARSRQFEKASSYQKARTLEKYFDIDALFSEQDPAELATRYLKSYRDVAFKTGFKGAAGNGQ